MKLLYFAWVKQKTGIAEETLDPPETVRYVADLIAFLSARGENYAAAFADLDRIRIAVNQTHVDLLHPVRGGDEIAFFPPVTGGAA